MKNAAMEPVVLETPQSPLIPVSQIRESNTNPRRSVRDAQFADLVASVKERGVLQPILVRIVTRDDRGPGYELVAGHRRLAAAREAGQEGIPAVVRELTDEQALEIQVIENLQRSDLHPLEEAEGYRQLMHVHKHDVARIAERIGRSAKYVYDRVKLLSLTKAAQKLFLDGRITAGHAVILARLKPKDQERAIEPEGHGSEYGGSRAPLFVHERTLFTPEEEKRATEAERKNPYFGKKTRSVRELQAWVDEHVRFDAGAADLGDLFPETHQALAGAKEEALKVVSITREYVIPEDARTDEKVLTERSWERADGREGSKPCEHSVLGVVVIGPGRGESFRVCTAKEKCKIHWASWQRERAKRKKGALAEGKTGESRMAAEHRKMEEHRARRELQHKAHEMALPKVLEAIAEKVRVAKATASGPLAAKLIEETLDWNQKPSTLVGPGKTAEDLVRHLAMNLITASARGGWGWEDLLPHARMFGVDASRILAPFMKQVQTSAKPEASSKKGAKPPRGHRPRKRGKKK